MMQCFFNIPSMHSLSSARRVSNIIEGVNGVKNVNTDYEKSIVGVFCENKDSVVESISNEVKKSGYEISLL
ncbi:heavy-metal-associated domain-containing protein [Clostridium cylindrosporum]|uniref:Copper chaperone n=1 Tax=Clostridium cylindrosporum DSM 605 TaxID=1121307 RepID=A0A0J8FZ06_CLOCY|nr:heavy-metal-associated domain-containing protein [Clostridium cylindrosporum]KMT20856.1 copper chaperone [Clostridium cylindrosporum DSM 605]